MTDINKRGLENETKGKIKEIEGKFRGDFGKATGDKSEHLKGRVEEAKGKIQKDFGKTERKVYGTLSHEQPVLCRIASPQRLRRSHVSHYSAGANCPLGIGVLCLPGGWWTRSHPTRHCHHSNHLAFR